MNFNVWKTLFTNDFDCKQYLYHYTSVEKAIKIIYSKQLWFSNITKTNDTTESKIRIVFTKTDSDVIIKPDIRTSKVSDYLSRNNDSVRILCFSRDFPLSTCDYKGALKFHKNHDKDKYFDISGRGFALPRMWAQYASNHEGVCFIINKEKFEKKLSSLVYLKKSAVAYKSFFAFYKINETQLDSLYNKITQCSNGYLSFFELLNTDKHFIEYNYFIKQKDWENEREYRYIGLVDPTNEHNSQNEIKIGGLFDYIEGIVIGEKIDPAYENVIRKTVEEKCDVKKIHFSTNKCIVE